MGEHHSKQQPTAGPPPPPPDMNEVLINLKMKSKTFQRQSGRCLKEKEKYYKQAKDALKKGNEEGAKMFLELAQTKENENMQYMRMATRLEAISCKLKGQMNNMEMIGSLNELTPILNANAQAMPLETMYKHICFNNPHA